METKLTKEELLAQLSEIQKKEKELKNELLYQKYKYLTFFQVLKKTVDWKALLIRIVLSEILVFMITPKESLYVLFILPILYSLASISFTLETYQKVKILKKQKSE